MTHMRPRDIHEGSDLDDTYRREVATARAHTE